MDPFPYSTYQENTNLFSQGPFQRMADRACEACNRKKTKCGKELPICGLCSRTSHECIYPTSRKRPSRHDHEGKAKTQRINGNVDRLLDILETNPNTDVDGQSTKSNKSHENPKRTGSSTSDLYGYTSLTAPTTSPGEGRMHAPPTSSNNQDTAQSPITYELATHLLDVYFDKVHSWLGIFHLPTFMDRANKILSKGENALKGLDTCDVMVFNGMFAMAARFSDHKDFVSIIPRDRGEVFGREARRCFKIVEDVEEVSIRLLQATLLLSVYEYAAGRSQKGRLMALFCVRAVYDLRLHEVDVADESEKSTPAEWIDLELQRRLFWCTWECDVFGTILKRRPFGIDWRHIRVNMPVNDEDWFAGRKVQSANFIPGPECWKTLGSGVPNQGGRAWMLLAKSMIGWLCDIALLKSGITKEQKASIESNISCFRLAMPESFSLSSSLLTDPNVSFVRKNYTIAANIYMCASAFTASQLPVIDDPTVRTQDQLDSIEAAQYRNRGLELCEIMRKWPPECVLYSPPNLACALLTFNESLVRLVPPGDLDTSYNDLSELVLSKFAERWTIAALLIRIRDITHHPERVPQDDPTNAKLQKEYPAYFHKVAIARDRRNKLRGLSGGDPYCDNSSRNNNTTKDDRNKSMPTTAMTPQNQQVMPDLATTTSISTAENSNFVNSYSTTGASPISLDAGLLNPGGSNVQNQPLYETPDDFDTIFSGFLEEPLWQDFHLNNFLP